MSQSTPILERTSETSHASYRRRYETPEAAAHYPGAFRKTWKDRSDLRTVLKGLAGISPGSHVLDLPCGAGRLTTELLDRGFRVTAVDVSPHMVARTRDSAAQALRERDGDASQFRCRTGDVLETGFGESEFDAVACSRLFHHFAEPGIRQAALRELSRICAGPLVVSFSNRFSLEPLQAAFRRLLGRPVKPDGAPISLAEFIADGRAAGLSAAQVLPTRWGISPLWYVVFRRTN